VTRISIEASFTWARRFIAREWALLLPVAFAFIAFPPFAINVLLPPKLRVVMTAEPNNLDALKAIMPWLVPTMLGLLAVYGVGALAITVLALKPRCSVGEAIVHAMRRLPILAGSFAILVGGLFFLTTIIVLLFQIVGLRGSQLQQAVISLLVVGSIALIARMTPLVAVIADRHIGPISAISETWMMGRGAALKMLACLLIYNIATTVIVQGLGKAFDVGLPALFAQVGWPDIAPPLVELLVDALAAIGIAGSYVLGVSFYRQLNGTNRGV
jgi:hypothetical protein